MNCCGFNFSSVLTSMNFFLIQLELMFLTSTVWRCQLLDSVLYTNLSLLRTSPTKVMRIGLGMVSELSLVGDSVRLPLQNLSVLPSLTCKLLLCFDYFCLLFIRMLIIYKVSFCLKISTYFLGVTYRIFSDQDATISY